MMEKRETSGNGLVSSLYRCLNRIGVGVGRLVFTAYNS